MLTDKGSSAMLLYAGPEQAAGTFGVIQSDLFSIFAFFFFKNKLFLPSAAE